LLPANLAPSIPEPRGRSDHNGFSEANEWVAAQTFEKLRLCSNFDRYPAYPEGVGAGGVGTRDDLRIDRLEEDTHIGFGRPLVEHHPKNYCIGRLGSAAIGHGLIAVRSTIRGGPEQYRQERDDCRGLADHQPAHQWRGTDGDDLGAIDAGQQLAAPARDILTTTPGGGFDFVSGSSFAAAHVSGVLALLLERAPGLAVEQLDEVLRRTSRSEREGASVAVPLVDACAALDQVATAGRCARGATDRSVELGRLPLQVQ